MLSHWPIPFVEVMPSLCRGSGALTLQGSRPTLRAAVSRTHGGLARLARGRVRVGLAASLQAREPVRVAWSVEIEQRSRSSSPQATTDVRSGSDQFVWNRPR